MYIEAIHDVYISRSTHKVVLITNYNICVLPEKCTFLTLWQLRRRNNHTALWRYRIDIYRSLTLFWRNFPLFWRYVTWFLLVQQHGLEKKTCSRWNFKTSKFPIANHRSRPSTPAPPHTPHPLICGRWFSFLPKNKLIHYVQLQCHTPLITNLLGTVTCKTLLGKTKPVFCFCRMHLTKN